MAYSEKVIDHYENPRNVGSFDKGDVNVGTGMVGAPACGDVMRLQIKVNDQGVITEVGEKKTNRKWQLTVRQVSCLATVAYRECAAD